MSFFWFKGGSEIDSLNHTNFGGIQLMSYPRIRPLPGN